MPRILVIGCPGAGKSTLARHIAGSLGLPVIHLDREFWLPGWVEPRREEWQARVKALADGSEWVIDGDYLRTVEVRVRRATHVVWLDLGRWRCLARILRRVLRHYGRARPDMTPGCPERLDWHFLWYVWRYRAERRPHVLAILAGLRPDQIAIVLRSPAAVRAFDAGLPATLRPQYLDGKAA